MNEDVDDVSRFVYNRERDRLVSDCLDHLSAVRHEIERGLIPPADEGDKVYREHLVSALEHAELELIRWVVPRETMV